MNTPIPRVSDPDTHEPFRQKSMMEKFVGYCWEKFAPKALAKISVMLAPLTLVIAGMFSSTPHQSEAIGIGLSALAIGIIDFIRSYIEHKMKWFPQKSLAQISEEEQAKEQPAIPYTADAGQSSTRSIMWEEARRTGMLSPAQIKADEDAVAEFRASLRPPLPVPVIPPTGFAVESWDKNDGEPTVTYYETKFQAAAFRDAQRLNHIRANLL